MEKKTLKDVARLARVSEATASYVINGIPKVGPKTRERVIKAMAALDYYPNAVARSLVVRQTRVIAHLLLEITNPFFPAVAKGVEDAAAGKGYNVVLCNTEGNPERELSYVRMAVEKQLDGVIFSTVTSRQAVEAVRRRGIPAVVVEWPEDLEDVDLVTVDNVGGTYSAVTHLASLGHRRIGFVNWVLGSPVSLERLEGYRKALSELGLAFDPGLVGTYDLKNGDPAAAAVGEIWKHPRPSAIVAVSDEIAIGLVHVFRRLGLAVPDDVSVTGYDDTLARFCVPQLTSVAQPVYRMGVTAFNMLLERVSGQHSGPARRASLATDLVVRGSTRVYDQDHTSGEVR